LCQTKTKKLLAQLDGGSKPELQHCSKSTSNKIKYS
jgi:hypothetical protein